MSSLTAMFAWIATHFLVLSEILRQGVVTAEEFGMINWTDGQERAFFQLMSGILTAISMKSTVAATKVSRRIEEKSEEKAEVKAEQKFQDRMGTGSGTGSGYLPPAA